MPDCDIDVARSDLFAVLRRIAADDSRESLHERKLLEYLRYRAGLSSESRQGDPISEYRDLRNEANEGLHDKIALAQVASLQARVVAWFVRVFTPPEQVVEAIRALASQPWRGHDQIVGFTRLATSDHHLRLLFAEIIDPAWLRPLRDAGIAQPPTPGTPWPVDGLLGGLAKSNPEAVADLVELLLADMRVRAKEEWGAAAFELLRFAFQLGPAGHTTVAEVARQHSQLDNVRSLAVHFALGVAPSDPVVAL